MTERVKWRNEDTTFSVLVQTKLKIYLFRHFINIQEQLTGQLVFTAPVGSYVTDMEPRDIHTLQRFVTLPHNPIAPLFWLERDTHTKRNRLKNLRFHNTQFTRLNYYCMSQIKKRRKKKLKKALGYFSILMTRSLKSVMHAANNRMQ